MAATVITRRRAGQLLPALLVYALFVAWRPTIAAGAGLLTAAVLVRRLEFRLGLWLIVLLGAFAGYIPVLQAHLILAVIVLRTVFDVLQRVHTFGRVPFMRIWVILLVLVALNLWTFGADREALQYAVGTYVDSFLLLFILANSKSTRDRRFVTVQVLISVVALIGLVSGAELILGHPIGLSLSSARTAYLPIVDSSVYQGTARLGSLLYNADWEAAGLTFGAVLAGTVAITGPRRRRNRSAVIAISLLLLALATLTRAVFIGLAAAVIALLIAGRWKDRLRLIGRLGVGFAIVIVVAPNILGTALARLEDPSERGLRVGAFETAANIIRAHPVWGLGMGYNRYLARAEPYRSENQYRPLAHPHNSLLEVGAMVGLPALVFYGLLIGAGVRRGIGRARASGVAPALAAMVAIASMSLTVNTITLPFLGSLFWASWWVACVDDDRVGGGAPRGIGLPLA